METVVYRAWPESEICAAIVEFNHQMHNGADSEQLSAGLHGLDFLTRRSEVSDTTRARLEGCEFEARFRIEMYAEKDAQDRTEAEALAHRYKVCDSIRRSVRQLEDLIDSYRGAFTVEQINEALHRRS